MGSIFKYEKKKEKKEESFREHSLRHNYVFLCFKMYIIHNDEIDDCYSYTPSLSPARSLVRFLSILINFTVV